MKKNLMNWAVCIAAVAALICLALSGCSANNPSGSSTSATNVAPVQSSSSSASAQAGQISVNLELKDSLDNEYAADSPNQFAEENLTVNVTDGATALDVLENSGRDVQTEGTGDSLEILSIGGLARGDAGSGSHWEMSINGEIQRMSPNVVTMKNGDTLTFNFVQQESAK